MNSKANILKQLEANTYEALNIASTILDSWGCTDSEKATILGISVNTYLAFKQGWEDIALNARQLECASYIFNIHICSFDSISMFLLKIALMNILFSSLTH